MRDLHPNRKRLFAAGLLGFLTLWLAYGCALDMQLPVATTAPTGPAQASATPAKGRAQIWAENCARCHNMRGPDWYSDGEWEVALQHMRVRGYLTGSEHKAIEEFLKAAN